MKSNLRIGLLVLSVAIPLCIGGLSAMLTRGTMKEYLLISKPPLSPPGWVFPIAWSILYVMMGLASYFVINSGADRELVIKALVFYGVQLVFNFFWSILFFNHALYLWAFIELVAMWITIVITTVLFFRISTPAGILMIPYILWSTFAGYLNFAIFKMSITPMPIIK